MNSKTKEQMETKGLLKILIASLILSGFVLLIIMINPNPEYKNVNSSRKMVEENFTSECFYEYKKSDDGMSMQRYVCGDIATMWEYKRLWTCSLSWTCSDGYTWIDKDILNEQGWEYSDLDYPPQRTALSHWAWSLPMQYVIGDTGTYRECTAKVINCFEINKGGK